MEQGGSKKALDAALEAFVAEQYSVRLTRRAQELHTQIVALIQRHDALIALGVLRLVEHQLSVAVLKVSEEGNAVS